MGMFEPCQGGKGWVITGKQTLLKAGTFRKTGRSACYPGVLVLYLLYESLAFSLLPTWSPRWGSWGKSTAEGVGAAYREEGSGSACAHCLMRPASPATSGLQTWRLSIVQVIKWSPCWAALAHLSSFLPFLQGQFSPGGLPTAPRFCTPIWPPSFCISLSSCLAILLIDIWIRVQSKCHCL